MTDNLSVPQDYAQEQERKRQLDMAQGASADFNVQQPASQPEPVRYEQPVAQPVQQPQSQTEPYGMSRDAQPYEPQADVQAPAPVQPDPQQDAMAVWRMNLLKNNVGYLTSALEQERGQGAAEQAMLNIYDERRADDPEYKGAMISVANIARSIDDPRYMDPGDEQAQLALRAVETAVYTETGRRGLLKGYGEGEEFASKEEQDAFIARLDAANAPRWAPGLGLYRNKKELEEKESFRKYREKQTQDLLNMLDFLDRQVAGRGLSFDYGFGKTDDLFYERDEKALDDPSKGVLGASINRLRDVIGRGGAAMDLTDTRKQQAFDQVYDAVKERYEKEEGARSPFTVFNDAVAKGWIQQGLTWVSGDTDEKAETLRIAQEMASVRNPRRVEGISDIRGVGSFGVFMLESFAEMIPQIAEQAASMYVGGKLIGAGLKALAGGEKAMLAMTPAKLDALAKISERAMQAYQFGSTMRLNLADVSQQIRDEANERGLSVDDVSDFDRWALAGVYSAIDLALDPTLGMMRRAFNPMRRNLSKSIRRDIADHVLSDKGTLHTALNVLRSAVKSGASEALGEGPFQGGASRIYTALRFGTAGMTSSGEVTPEGTTDWGKLIENMADEGLAASSAAIFPALGERTRAAFRQKRNDRFNAALLKTRAVEKFVHGLEQADRDGVIDGMGSLDRRLLAQAVLDSAKMFDTRTRMSVADDASRALLEKELAAHRQNMADVYNYGTKAVKDYVDGLRSVFVERDFDSIPADVPDTHAPDNDIRIARREAVEAMQKAMATKGAKLPLIYGEAPVEGQAHRIRYTETEFAPGKFSISVRDEVDGRKPEDAQDTFVVGEDGTADEVRAKALAYGHQLARFHEALRRDDVPRANLANAVLERAGKKGQRVFFVSTKEELMSKGFKEDAVDDGGRSLYGSGNSLSNAWSAFTTPDGRIFIRREAVKTYGELMAALFHETFHRDFGSAVTKVSKDEAALRELRLSGVEAPDDIVQQLVRGALLGIRLARPVSIATADDLVNLLKSNEWREFKQRVTDAEERLAYKSEYLTGGVDKGRPISVLEHPFRAVFYSRAKKAFPRLNAMLKSYLAAMSGVEVTDQMVADFVGAMQENAAGGENFITNVADGSFGTAEDRTVQQLWDLLDGDPDVDATGGVFAGQGERQQAQRDEEDAANTVEQPVADVEEVAPYAGPEKPAPEPKPQPSNADRTKQRQKEIDDESARRLNDENAADKKEEARRKEAASENRRIASDIKKADREDELQRKEESDEAKRIVSDIKKADTRDYAKQKAAVVDDSTAVPAAVRKVVRNAKTTVQSNTDRMNEIEDAKKAGKSSSVTRSKRIKKFWSGEEGADGVAKTMSPVEDLAYDFGVVIDKYNADLALSRDKSKKQDVRDAAGRRLSKLRARVSQLIGADLSGKLFRGEPLTDADGDAILAMWNEKTKGAPSVRRTADKREYVKKDKVPAANQSQNGSHRTIKTREEVLKMNEDKSPVEQSLLEAIERGGLAPMQLLQDAVDFSKQLRANESRGDALHRGVRAEDNKVKARTLRNVAESPEGVAAVIEMLRRVVSELKPGQAKKGTENARSLLKAYEQKWRDMVGVPYDRAEVRAALPDHTDAIMNLPIGTAEVEDTQAVMDPRYIRGVNQIVTRDGQTVEIRPEDEALLGELDEEDIEGRDANEEAYFRGRRTDESDVRVGEDQDVSSAESVAEEVAGDLDARGIALTDSEEAAREREDRVEDNTGLDVGDETSDEDVGIGEARVDAATQKRLADADGDVDKIVKIVNDKATPIQSLAKIATEHKNPAVRLASIEPLGARSAIHVAGQALFVLEADPDPDVSEAASKKISDLDLDPENFGMFASGESIARAMRDAGHPELWNGLQKAKALLRRKRREWADLSHDEKVEIKKASDGWEFVDGHWVNDGDPVHFNPKSPFAKDVLALSGRMFAAREAVKNAVFDKLQEKRRDVLTKLEMIRAANRHAIGALARFCGLRHPDVAEFTYLEDEFPELREETQNIIMENGGAELRSLYNDFVSAGYREDNMLPDVLAGNEIDAAIEADPTLEVARIEFSPIIDNSIAVYGQRDENNTMTLSLSALIQGPEAVANTLVHEFGHIQEDLEAWAPGGSEESVGKQALSRLGIDSYTAYYRLSGEVMSRALEARRRLTHEERLGSLLQDTMDLDVKAEDRLNLLEMREDKDGSFLLQMSRSMFASSESSAQLFRQYGGVVQRRNIAADPNTSSEDLDRLANDDDGRVLRAVAKNPNTSESTLEWLAGFGGDRAWVAEEIAKRTDLPSGLAERLAHHNVSSVRVAFAKAHPEFGMTPTEAMDWRNPEWGDKAPASELGTPMFASATDAATAEAQRQYDEVVAKYRGTPQWLKAPNGKDTNLTEHQWVQVRTPAFKAWFGDWENDPANASKVVDENGEPLVVYHGTNFRFYTFSEAARGKHDYGWFGRGYYFFAKSTDSLDAWKYEDGENPAKDAAVEYGKNVMPVFLNIANPYRTSSIDTWTTTKQEADDFSSRLTSEGYDGIEVEGSDGVREIVSFSPNQIKSATDNVGTFSGANQDIRFASATSADTARSLFSRFGLDPAKFGLRPNADGTVDYDMTMDALLRRLQTYFGDMTFDFGHVRRSLQEVANLARSMIVERPKDVDELIKRMLEAAEKKEHPPVGEVELAVLYLNEVAAEERFRAAFEAYAAEGSMSDEERARRSREYTEADAALVEAATALSTAKSSTGAALNANKMMLRSDYTYGGLVSRAIHEIRRNAGLRRAGKQGPLTENERKQLRDMALKVAAAEKKLREAQEKIRELEGKKAAQAEIDAAVNNARKNGNERKKKDGKNDADHVETVDEAVEYAKKTLAARLDPSKGGAPVNLADWGQVNVAIQDLVRRIGKAIAADYGLKNAMRRMPFEQFEAELFKRCDPVFGSLKAFDGSRGGIVAREYVNLFSDYEQYNKMAPSYDPIAKAVRELVSLSKRMEDLRRIKETGTGFDRYGYAKLTSVKDVDEEMQRVSRALAEADRASGVSNFVRKDPNAKATALDLLKKGWLEEIRSLEDHIKNKTPLPPSLREIVEDGDAKRIRELLAERRAEYDATFGPAWEKWTDDQRLDYVLKQLEKRLAADNRKLANLEKYRRTSSFRVGKDGGIHFIRDTREILEKKAEVRDVERRIRETRAIIDPETNKVLLAQRMLQVQLDRKQHYKDKCQRFEEAAKRKDGGDPRGRSELRAFLHDEEWTKAWNEANEERRKADELLGKFVYDRASWIGKRAMEWGSLVQVMRSYLASGDESGINIQCAWYAMQHPVKAVRAALLGLRSTWNKEVWDKMSKDFLDNPRAQVILEQMGVKVPLSNWGYGGARSEEVFSRDWLAKNKFKVFGVNLGDNAWLRTSERMFAIPVMKFRIDMANAYLDFLEKMYGSISQIKKDELEYGGRVINAVTGAGDFFGSSRIKAGLSTFFWAPGRVSSQLQTMFLPATIFLHNEVSEKFRWKIASEHIIGAWAKLVGFYMMLAFAGRVFGGGDDDDGEPLVDFDPRSNRFAKIRVFGRYVSITGNLEQYPRLLWRGIVGAKVGSDGVAKKYGEGMAGDWMDDFWRTIQGKLRPEFNTVATLMNGGKDAIGRQVNMKRLGKPFNDNGLLNFFLMNGVRPLTVGEIYETCEANGIPRAIVPSVLAFVGITGSDYGQTPYTRARNRLRRLDASLKSDEVPNEVKLSLRRDAFNARLIAMKSSLGKLEKEAKDLRKDADSADSAKERRELVSKAEAVEKRYIDMVYGVR